MTELSIRNLSGFEHFQAFVKECNCWARRNNRVSMKWEMPEAVVNPMWDAWYLSGGYKGTNKTDEELLSLHCYYIWANRMREHL